MKALAYPLRHVSIRVPWHDSGWSGTVCNQPRQNTACLKLANIAESKVEADEEAVRGQSLKDMDPARFPPCVKERGTFMAPFSLDRLHEHPYVKTSPDTHAHFKPTRLHYPAYAAAGLPFRWMMKPAVFGDEERGERGLVESFPLEGVDPSFEDDLGLKFKTHWVQDHRNHRALLDCFWNHVQPEESLVFFYAKQVPLVEETGRRVLIGAGRLLKLGPLTEYEYDGSTQGKNRSLLWERMVIHSIRPGFKDGFLLPYQEALATSDEGRAFDPAEVVAFAPEDRFTEFSYATEHVGHDAAIAALLACRAALLRSAELFNVATATQEAWIDQQLGRLWKKRGPFPGLGSVLGATGVPMAHFVAQALVDKVGEDGNPWTAWQAAVADPRKHLPADLARRLDSTIAKSWQKMQPQRRQVLELLSRIDLTAEQAGVLAVPETRAEQGIVLDDADLLRNPYLVYEATRLTPFPVAVGTVDRGVFPTTFVREQHPLPEQSVVRTAVDARRLRALTIRELENAIVRGDTLAPQAAIIASLRKGAPEKDEHHTPVTADLLAVAEDEQFPGEIRLVEMADSSRAYQLERLAKAGELIRSTVDKRAAGQSHEINADWRRELDHQLKALPAEGDERDKEEHARQEKAAALAELAARRFSVLIGPAGTGKTTLLSVLCRHPAIQDDGILMLAPTGKARVRMEDVARHAGIQNLQALTLAQYLARSKPPRYEGATGRYRLTGQAGEKGPRTVIVDECSMLTEEMTAALLEALSGVHRLIFVGDPRQLPPIGAGRPFADVIARLQPQDIETRFPRIGPGYAELTVPRRQGAGEREDLQLAAWFGGGVLSPGEDQVFEILAGQRSSQTVQFVRWDTPDELDDLLPKTLAAALGFDAGREEWQSFACSLGGNLDDKGSAWFNAKWGDKYPGAGAAAERWQLLSPVRQKPWGVDTLNRSIHLRYKGPQIEKARNPGKYRSIPKPMGDNQIIYGDKVINNRNWSVWKKRIYPEPASNGYLANGEIGVVVGHRRTQKRNWFPDYLEIEFATQVGHVFKFRGSDFDDDGDARLELAYALTVHKAQGSEFEVVLLVLPRSPQMLTRELLYTALTRQKQKVIVLHQGSATDLQRLSAERYSATASRLTNLFGPPRPVAVGDTFLEDRLIHRTSCGEAVRSKSEVIIANLLYAQGIDYHYEHPLELDGVVKYPDFTIEDDDAGITYLWEHCGLLHDSDYRRRWEEKQQWYREHGILPLEQGGGPKGTLIVTRDQPDGGIDSANISALIAKIGGRRTVNAFLEQLNNKRLRSYDADPGLLKEHFGIEETVLAGGYGYRQILELVQNGADALLEAQQRGHAQNGNGRIHVQLSGSRLYVANTGAPLSEEGLDALLRSHSSPKRGNQIGRFGLGFKSLLNLNGRIDVFTRASGAIRFDPERCREELRRQFQVTSAPGLRLAWALPPDERAADPLCAELAWAETIVRVEVGSERLLQHIRQEIRSFPAEFLLFFPIATTLTLDDGEQQARGVRQAIEGPERILHDGDAVSRWRIAAREVRITETRAIADATHIHARESVPVSWAMPLEGRREEVGRFWAFFPTHTQTYLPGILNAPWKLNSDRNAIIGGEWNAALMAEAARLIADTLPGLATPDDPARPLDAFPRQLDRKDEDAAPLVESLWTQLVAAAAVIPDGTGALRHAPDLWRHPKDTLTLAAAWQSLAGAAQQRLLVHASCLERQRASRLNALAERIEASATGQGPPALRRCSTESWFDMVAAAEPEAALGVLRLAESFSSDAKSGEWSQARPTLAIIPTQSGKLVTAARVVLAPEGVSVPGRESVAAEIQSNPEARRILSNALDVGELDDQVWASILAEALQVPNRPAEAREAGWQAFWSRLRRAPAGVRRDFLETYRSSVRVRRRDGRWVQADSVLLPGGLVSDGDPPPNSNVLIDSDAHGNDRTSLVALGVADVPAGDIGPADFDAISGETRVLGPWLRACRAHYKATHKNSASWSYLEPSRLSMPRGYGLLAEITGASQARFTVQLLDRLAEPSFQKSVSFGHSTTAAYARVDVPHPLPWFVLNHGAVQLGSSTAPLKALVARRDESALRSLPSWTRIEPALHLLELHLDSVSVSPSDLRAFWTAVIAELATPESVGGDTLTDLWLGAAKDGVVPTELPSPTGRVPLSEAFVTPSADLARRARTPGRVVVVLDPPTMQLWLQAGAQNLAGLIQAEWDAIAGPPERLTDVVPELVDVLHAEFREAARCQRVTQLRLRIADTAEVAPCLMWDGALLLDAEQLAPLSRAERLGRLLAEIAATGWLDGSLEAALQRLGDAGVAERRAHVAQGATLAECLLRAAGSRMQPLLDALGQPLRDMDFVRQCTPQQLAELVLAQLGPAALTALRDTLEDEGLQPPARWSTSAAPAFAAAIGFPPEFASSAEARREPEELISEPIELPPLHDFQQEVFEGLGSLLASGSTRRRAVISLPTGGGKTRVTVEAAVRLVLVPTGTTRSVLWIAQTDELCEQAVQAFRQVWVNLGARRTDLRIARLWGGNPNPTGRDMDKPVVVVASIQTLNNRVGAADLDWLRKPGLVVVDECHHAITPSYSALLRWLDAEAPRPGAAERDEPPIVGLSATPFRTDDDESQRLARRFDSRWLPSDQERLYARLLSQGVLARAQYESLDSGVGLTDDELAKLGRLPESWEGLDFENLLEAINQRLAGDARRNERLVECIEASAERSILFFTNSVVHAEEMAARLNLSGIGAAAISGGTPTVARRYFLERFQGGAIRVLCNHSVLTTGFDAPRTDMVLIARQVFSPVRYMQMVGRGLRGEKNGGTASCRIVTVVDNLGRFADRHPYHYCRQYFSAMERAEAAVEVQS